MREVVSLDAFVRMALWMCRGADTAVMEAGKKNPRMRLIPKFPLTHSSFPPLHIYLFVSKFFMEMG